MTPARSVTERDFRLPEFRDAKVEDYEFREDGKVVRRDRWETGIRRLVSVMGLNVRSFEIDEVVEAVKKLADDADSWNALDMLDSDDWPAPGQRFSVRLKDGSVLQDALFSSKAGTVFWTWRSENVTEDVIAWREPLID